MPCCNLDCESGLHRSEDKRKLNCHKLRSSYVTSILITKLTFVMFLLKPSTLSAAIFLFVSLGGQQELFIIVFFFIFSTYGLLIKCEVQMAGYWPSSFFACLWTETKSRSINSQKKERGQYPAILTKQTCSIKDLLYGFWGNFACGIQRVVPSGQDGSILPARVANHSARFGSSCPLAELAI